MCTKIIIIIIIPGKHEIKELQKTAIPGTAHILREVLMYMYKTYFMSEITLRGTNCKYRQLQHSVP